jgi:hypothetical protein
MGQISQIHILSRPQTDAAVSLSHRSARTVTASRRGVSSDGRVFDLPTRPERFHQRAVFRKSVRNLPFQHQTAVNAIQKLFGNLGHGSRWFVRRGCFLRAINEEMLNSMEKIRWTLKCGQRPYLLNRK